ncbi:MAG: hypothetical protein KIT33_05425 [Candidatus Kapabacteria bacterium]|nr:hypothetical protein [Ignavibacteriota bacterium]MCW5884397.1 hypothetical protein [Candidatus Kapabacteria bacterium]
MALSNILKIITFYLIIIIICFVKINSEPTDFCTLKKGDKVKLLNNSNNRNVVYIFTDINSCFSCYESIKYIEIVSIKNDFTAIVVLDGLNKSEAENLKKENGWDIDVIGDETGLYHSYYKISLKPSILGLSKDGLVIECGNLNNTVFKRILLGFKEVDEAINKNDSSNRFVEVFRMAIKDDNKNITSNGIHVDVIFNTAKKEYYLRNLRKPSLLIVNSDGQVIKKINEERLKSEKIYYSNESLSWVVKDSILSFVNVVFDFNKIAYFYDVVNDTIIYSVKFENPEFEEKTKTGPIIKFNNILNSFMSYVKIKNANNIILDSSYNCIFVFDRNGKHINSFDAPDEIYRRYRVSTWFYEKFDFNHKSNNFISLQQFSNKIKFWDKNLNLVGAIDFNFGDTYRIINDHLPDLIGKENHTKNVGNVTRTSSLMIDENTNEILVCYYNETFPEGETDPFSDNVIIDKNVLILDENGNWKYNSPYKTNGSFIPFHFGDSLIYGTEINEKKHLEIVCYRIK